MKERLNSKHLESDSLFSESLRVKWVGRPKKTTMEVKGEGKSGSKVNEMGEVPLSNRDRPMFNHWSVVEWDDPQPTNDLSLSLNHWMNSFFIYIWELESSLAQSKELNFSWTSAGWIKCVCSAYSTPSFFFTEPMDFFHLAASARSLPREWLILEFHRVTPAPEKGSGKEESITNCRFLELGLS
jgi:hypothetical protein